MLLNNLPSGRCTRARRLPAFLESPPAYHDRFCSRVRGGYIRRQHLLFQLVRRLLQSRFGDRVGRLHRPAV